MKVLPQIKTLKEKKLLGMHLSMSLQQNKTFDLWRSFMPRRKEIKNVIGPELYSIQVYPHTYNFNQFDLNASFEKWAAIEVSNFNSQPEGMEAFTLKEGLYAAFHYKGNPSTPEPFFRYIFADWLPNSIYEIDTRPHFEILGEKYKNNDPESEEEIWIPIKLKH